MACLGATETFLSNDKTSHSGPRNAYQDAQFCRDWQDLRNTIYPITPTIPMKLVRRSACLVECSSYPLRGCNDTNRYGVEDTRHSQSRTVYFGKVPMSVWRPSLAWIGTMILGIAWATADEVRYFEQNGVTIRETKQVVQRPVCEVQWQPTSRTVYREQISTEYRDQVRTTWAPVTQYRCQTYLQGQACPSGQPYYATCLVPETRWEARSETIKTPVVCRRWVPQNETVQTPVTTQRMVSQEVVTRVAVNAKNEPLTAATCRVACSMNCQPCPASCAPCLPRCPTVACAPASCCTPVQPYAAWGLQNPTAAPTEQVGGVARLEQDPPRYGDSAAWRASPTLPR